MNRPARKKSFGSILNEPLSARGFGVFAVVAGAALGWVCIIDPLQAASRHEGIANFSKQGAVMAPALLVMGLLQIVLGDRALPILGKPNRPSLLGWLIYAGSVGIGFLFYGWLKGLFRSRGYEI